MRICKDLPLILILSFIYLVCQSQVFYRADLLPFNSPFDNEMAPVIYKDGIIFSSNRKNDVVLVTVDQEGNFMYNLYFVKNKGGKNWGSVELLARELSSQYNQSSAYVSSDGNTLFYTSTIGPNVKVGDYETGDTLKNGIFISTWQNNRWSYPEPFPYNNESYDVANPFISDDGRYLYFASRDPEGLGKYDIWISELKNGKWEKPINMGPVINTSESEVFPYIYRGNRLYFASGGHNSEGSLDIFYSDKIDDKWSTPVRMPKPFNSRYDDFGFVVNINMDTGYFTSNRKGTDDIYSFVSTFPNFTECPEQVEEVFCYEFYEAGNMVLDTTSLRYEWDLGDGTRIRSTRANHCYVSPGHYLVQLKVIDTLTGDIYFSEATYNLNVEKTEQPYILAPDTAYVDEEVTFDGSLTSINSFLVRNYYWDFGDGSFNNVLKPSHSYTRQGTYIVKLGVTDNPKEKKIEPQKRCANKKIVIIRR